MCSPGSSGLCSPDCDPCTCKSDSLPLTTEGRCSSCGHVKTFSLSDEALEIKLIKIHAIKLNYLRFPKIWSICLFQKVQQLLCLLIKMYNTTGNFVTINKTKNHVRLDYYPWLQTSPQTIINSYGRRSLLGDYVLCTSMSGLCHHMHNSYTHWYMMILSSWACDKVDYLF